MEIEEYWECEVKEELASNKERNRMLESYRITVHDLHIIDGFCGGRTAPSRINFKTEDGRSNIGITSQFTHGSKQHVIQSSNPKR